MSSFLLVLGLALAAPTEPVKPEAKPPTGAEVQDLILLHEETPLRLRLKITNGDQSVFARWHDHMERWFKYADKDSNGTLDGTEMERVPNVQQMQQMMTTGQFYPQRQLGGVAGGMAVRDLDLDNDGKVDRHEYITHFATTPAGPIQVAAGYSPYAAQGVGSGVVSDALFKTLDANRDGKLSRDEVGRAGELLGKFDSNDDEIISAQELMGGNLYQYQQPVARGGAGLNLMPLPREANDQRLTGRLKFAKDLVARLDDNKNSGLEHREFRVPSAEFDKLDINRDSRIDALELVKWLVGPPDVEILARMETLVGNDPVVEATGKGVVAGKATASGLEFKLGDALLQIDRNNANLNRAAVNAGANMKRYYEQIFNVLDTQKTGKVTVEEINKNPQASFLRQSVQWLDLDGDSVVTLEEIAAFIELTSGGAQCQMSIGFLDQGRGLFEILDTLPDGQLSIGELRTAGKVLGSYLKERLDALERTDIPRRYQLVVVTGSNYGGQIQMPGMAGMARPRPVRPGQLQNPGRGPSWFQKMDVNGDGYVSPREFLGPTNAFKQLDTETDGLISSDEADRYEAEQKARKESRQPESVPEPPTEKR